jgi:hypothetical protein
MLAEAYFFWSNRAFRGVISIYILFPGFVSVACQATPFVFITTIVGDRVRPATFRHECSAMAQLYSQTGYLIRDTAGLQLHARKGSSTPRGAGHATRCTNILIPVNGGCIGSSLFVEFYFNAD